MARRGHAGRHAGELAERSNLVAIRREQQRSVLQQRHPIALCEIRQPCGRVESNVRLLPLVYAARQHVYWALLLRCADFAADNHVQSDCGAECGVVAHGLGQRELKLAGHVQRSAEWELQCLGKYCDVPQYWSLRSVGQPGGQRGVSGSAASGPGRSCEQCAATAAESTNHYVQRDSGAGGRNYAGVERDGQFESAGDVQRGTERELQRLWQHGHIPE